MMILKIPFELREFCFHLPLLFDGIKLELEDENLKISSNEEHYQRFETIVYSLLKNMIRSIEEFTQTYEMIRVKP